MRLSNALLVVIATAFYTVPSLSATVTPVLKHAFTAHVLVGKPVGPIPTDSQLTVVEPITGGKITGPSFNGVIASGGASVIDFNTSLTVAKPSVEIWGTTDDHKPYFVRASGVGVKGAQVARVEVSVSGKYAALENEFILASFADNDSNPPTYSTIEAWVVSRG